MSPNNPNSPYYRAPEYTALAEEDEGTYVGEKDAQGMRCGTGTCTWADGSKYHGDWNQNVRHGNGSYETPCDNTKFEGQWVNDHKHGNGEQVQRDGTIVRGTWQRDRLNGLAQIQRGGKGEFHTIIFKDDMKIETNDTGVSTCDKVYAAFACFMLVAFLAVLVIGVVVG